MYGFHHHHWWLTKKLTKTFTAFSPMQHKSSVASISGQNTHQLVVS